MADIDRFFDAYVEGDLSTRQSAEFCDWLRASEQHVDLFVRESFLHGQLFAVLRQRSLQADILEEPANKEAKSSPAPAVGRRTRAVGGRASTARRLNRAAMAMAASLALVGGLSIWNVSRSAAVGQLTQATADVKWQSTAAAHKAGALLHEGDELRLDRGRVLATLVSGARIILEGPARLRVEDENRVRLKFGRVGATVPPQAVGFTVETPVGEVVDLGTEFTLDLQREGDCRLYVFSGMVEMRPLEESEENPPFKIPQTAAVSYDPESGAATPIPCDAEAKLSL